MQRVHLFYTVATTRVMDVFAILLIYCKKICCRNYDQCYSLTIDLQAVILGSATCCTGGCAGVGGCVFPISAQDL